MSNLFVTDILEVRIFSMCIDIFVLFGIFSIVKFLFNSVRFVDVYLRVKETELLANMKITNEDFVLLDIIIDECLNEFIISNNFITKEYITERDEHELITSLPPIVSSRISNTIMGKLKLIYNAKNITDIISNRIYMHITTYVTKTNTKPL